MPIATIRFHGVLNFFLPRHQRKQIIAHHFDWRTSIKDMLESLGPPHPEMAMLVVNGHSVDFDIIVAPDDHIEVYDRFDPVSVPDAVRLRPEYGGRPRFVLDTHLGRLANYLRMLGFDTLYRNDYVDDGMAHISHHEQRILLTRDIGLLKRSLVVYGYYVRETNPKRRIVEVMHRFNLHELVAPFRRCTRCNGLLRAVHKSDILPHLSQATMIYYDEFHQCASCHQVYWKGSHFDHLQRFMGEVLNDDQRTTSASDSRT